MATLICDDDPRLRALYRQEFEWAGVDVIEAGDGIQCLEAAASQQPELIVLDLGMPRRGGLSILPELRRCCPQAQVLVVTAHSAVEILSLSRRLGAAACFSKPGFLSRIPEVVERYLADGVPAPAAVLTSPSDDAAAG